MTLVTKPVAVIALVLGLLGTPGSAAAGNGQWVSFVDKTWGIRVSIPASWHTVPLTVAGVRSLSLKLTTEKQAGLAAVYSRLIATRAAQTQLLGYLFQAFDYSPSASQQLDFALAFARTTPAIAKNVGAIEQAFAASYAKKPGTTIARKAVVRLPAGSAAFVSGSQTQVGSPPTQFEIFVLPHGTLLYTFTFRADTVSPGAAAVFTAIAHRFAFTS